MKILRLLFLGSSSQRRTSESSNAGFGHSSFSQGNFWWKILRFLGFLAVSEPTRQQGSSNNRQHQGSSSNFGDSSFAGGNFWWKFWDFCFLGSSNQQRTYATNFGEAAFRGDRRPSTGTYNFIDFYTIFLGVPSRRSIIQASMPNSLNLVVGPTLERDGFENIHNPDRTVHTVVARIPFIQQPLPYVIF